MGVIQNAINQMLGTAGIAARLSPDYETKQELHKLGKQQQILDKQAESAELRGTEQVTDPDLLRNLGDIKERQLDLSKRKFQLAPTKEGFQDVVSKQQSYRRFNKMEDILLQKQDQALNQAAQKSESKQSTKRNFMSFLKNVEIAGGGKVGDLPLNVQKQIAKQYSKGERKALMNTMDTKGENKK